MVEQRTENPRVGGSTPSLATILLRRLPLRGPASLVLAVGSAAVLPACGADDCEVLCEDVATLLDECVDDWPMTWDELGANGRISYRNECRENWSDLRADLESWELDDALAQCDEGRSELNRTAASASSCDQMRALYALD